MSKGSLFWGNAKGKLGQLVLSNLKGQQIARAYQPNVNNPRTPAQMFQRATFAAPVQFYKHATQALFKFAYTDKKPQESDFNAFMRHNSKNAALLTREQFVDQNVPKIGRYLLSVGDLGAPAMTLSGSGNAQISVGVISADIVGTQSADAEITLGTLSNAIIRNISGVINGDIVTLVFIASDADFSPTQPYIQAGSDLPTWYIYQFRLDITSEEPMTNVIGDDLFDAKNSPASAVDLVGANDTKAVACVVSRPTADGVRVSTSRLVNHPDVETALSKMLSSSPNFDKSWDDVCMASWAAADKAVLEGSLLREVEPTPPVPNITVDRLTLDAEFSETNSSIFDIVPSGVSWTGSTLLVEMDGAETALTCSMRTPGAYRFVAADTDILAIYYASSQFAKGLIKSISTMDTIKLISLTVGGVTYPFATA